MTTERGVNIPIILAPKLMSHACALLINNVGNYLYLNNGRFKFEDDLHQFNLRLQHFSQFQRKKKIFKIWQVCDWLVKWLILLGFMDLRWPRVYWNSKVGLVPNVKFVLMYHRRLQMAHASNNLCMPDLFTELTCFLDMLFPDGTKPLTEASSVSTN